MFFLGSDRILPGPWVCVQEEVPLHPSCVYHGIPECQSLGELRYHLSQPLQSEDFLTLSRTATPQLGREEITTEMTMDLRNEPIGRWWVNSLSELFWRANRVGQVFLSLNWHAYGSSLCSFSTDRVRVQAMLRREEWMGGQEHGRYSLGLLTGIILNCWLGCFCLCLSAWAIEDKVIQNPWRRKWEGTGTPHCRQAESAGKILCKPQWGREALLLPRWCRGGFLVGESFGESSPAWEGRSARSLHVPEGGWLWVGKTSELVPDTWKASGGCWKPVRVRFCSWLQKDEPVITFPVQKTKVSLSNLENYKVLPASTLPLPGWWEWSSPGQAKGELGLSLLTFSRIPGLPCVVSATYTASIVMWQENWSESEGVWGQTLPFLPGLHLL